MKRVVYLLIATALTFAYSNTFAQTEEPTTPVTHGDNFVDLNGDGYNDNAPDNDGDGIPNGMDPDYIPTGSQDGSNGFVDLDGDGINDNAGQGMRGSENGKGGQGPKNEFKNQSGNDSVEGDGSNGGNGSPVQRRRGGQN